MLPLSKAKLKFFSSLLIKKYRYRHRMFLVEGKKLCQEALKSSYRVEALIVNEVKEMGEILPGGMSEGFPVYSTTAQVFSSLSTHENPEGILAVVHFPETIGGEKKETALHWQRGPGIILDGIQDPGNLGTIIRTADWFGIPYVICLQGTVDIYNPKVLRSSMGSMFRVEIIALKEAELPLASLGSRLCVASMEGLPLSQVAIRPDDFLLLGNEANGISISPTVLPEARWIHIPGTPGAESLNVGVAAGILAWQQFVNSPFS